MTLKLQNCLTNILEILLKNKDYLQKYKVQFPQKIAQVK